METETRGEISKILELLEVLLRNVKDHLLSESPDLSYLSTAAIMISSNLNLLINEKIVSRSSDAQDLAAELNARNWNREKVWGIISEIQVTLGLVKPICEPLKREPSFAVNVDELSDITIDIDSSWSYSREELNLISNWCS